MNDSWDARIDRFWDSADDARPDAMLRDMRILLAELADDDPVVLYELASLYDFLGREHDAIPLYRAAIEGGLQGARSPQATIQLASSLRNIGEPAAAVELLSGHQRDPKTGDAALAFLALALRDCGRHDEAISVLLKALAPTLALYGRSILSYADELNAFRPDSSG